MPWSRKNEPRWSTFPLLPSTLYLKWFPGMGSLLNCTCIHIRFSHFLPCLAMVSLESHPYWKRHEPWAISHPRPSSLATGSKNKGPAVAGTSLIMVIKNYIHPPRLTLNPTLTLRSRKTNYSSATFDFGRAGFRPPVCVAPILFMVQFTAG